TSRRSSTAPLPLFRSCRRPIASLGDTPRALPQIALRSPDSGRACNRLRAAVEILDNRCQNPLAVPWRQTNLFAPPSTAPAAIAPSAASLWDGRPTRWPADRTRAAPTPRLPRETALPPAKIPLLAAACSPDSPRASAPSGRPIWSI